MEEILNNDLLSEEEFDSLLKDVLAVYPDFGKELAQLLTDNQEEDDN